MIISHKSIIKENITFKTYIKNFLKENRVPLERSFSQLFQDMVFVLKDSDVTAFLEDGIISPEVLSEVNELITEFANINIPYLTDNSSKKILEQLEAVILSPEFMASLKLEDVSQVTEYLISGYTENLSEIYSFIENDDRIRFIDKSELNPLIKQGSALAHNHLRASVNFYLTMREAGVNKATATEKVLRGIKKKTKERAKSYAVNAILNNYRKNELATVRELERQGVLVNVTKRWSTSKDNRVCPICKGLEAYGEVSIDKPFIYEGREYMGDVGAHPRCRCAQLYMSND